MKTKVAILIMIMVLTAFAAMARMIDYKCLNDCLAQGYMYGYCQRICSY